MNKIAAITIVALLAVATDAAAGKRGGGTGRPEGPVHDLHQQIAAKLLFDGLRLTPEQRTALAAKLGDAQAFRAERAAARESHQKDLEAALIAARDDVYRTGTIGSDTRARLEQVHRDAREDRAGDGQPGAGRKDGKAGRPQIVKDVEAILTPQQLDYLRDFDAKRELGLGEPGERHERRGEGIRGGKHGDGPGAKVSERIKGMSEEEYQQHRKQILDRAREHMQERQVADASARVETLARQLDTLRSGTPEQVAELEADHALPLILGRAAMHGFRERRERRHDVDLLLSAEFQALVEGRDPLQATRAR